MLSFKKGIPIAVVKGGKRDGQIVRLFSGSIDEENAEIADVMNDQDALIDVKNILDRLHEEDHKFNKLEFIKIMTKYGMMDSIPDVHKWLRETFGTLLSK